MNIEDSIFNRHRPDFTKLKNYGFKKQGNNYYYQHKFFDNQFEAEISINSKQQVTGTVIDTATNEEYIPLRAVHLGPFASEVRNQYTELLNDIAKNCFINEPFISAQANRLTQKIKELYHDKPEFVFVRYPHTALFREPEFKKWYAVISDVRSEQVIYNDPHGKGAHTSAMNFRVTPKQRTTLLKQDGFYPAYGTIKKNWLSVLLDDTQSDQVIFDCLKASHDLLTHHQSWIIPANPKYYDIMHGFDNTDTIEWNQRANIRIGDTVFIYVTAPIKSVIYKCQVLQNNLPYHYQDKNLKVKRVMKIKLLKRYAPHQFDLDFLKANGVKAIRGARHLTKEVLNELNKK